MGHFQKGDKFDYFYDGESEISYIKAFKYDDIEGTKIVHVLFYEDLIFTYSISSIRTYYVLVFEDENLIYWGLPEDYYKSGNKKLIKIADRFYDEYQKLTK